MTEARPEQKASVCLALRQFTEELLGDERNIVDGEPATKVSGLVDQVEQEGIAELCADAAMLIDGRTFKEAMFMRQSLQSITPKQLSTLVVARLRIPDGREFDVRQDWPAGPREDDDIDFYWTEGDMSCDCKRLGILQKQHGLELDGVSCSTKVIELVSLKADGVEQLKK